MAYSITFRSAEKTLADADIADAMDKILKGLAEELGAQRRDKEGIGISERKYRHGRDAVAVF